MLNEGENRSRFQANAHAAPGQVFARFTRRQAPQNRGHFQAYVLLTTKPGDGVDGLITITSGNGPHRLMAEATVDLVCQKLNSPRPCRTHLEALPGAEKGHYHQLGVSLQRWKPKITLVGV
jgi:glycerol-3-phosphate dehydrogenase